MAYNVLENCADQDRKPQVSRHFWRKFGHVAFVGIFSLGPAAVFADRAYNAAQKSFAAVQAPLNTQHGLESSANPVNNAVADSLMAFAAGMAGGLASNLAFEQADQVMARRAERREDEADRDYDS